jgi:diaminohydroxyphosphoribosylaminopyrimidine deaminase/5-amino-6-(5-phosphoribosylamino)uracil reductase
MALRDGQERGWSPAGATAYVTLEPCSHHGRTPPCADALVAAGLARVVIALLDPNPQVAGEGVRRLKEAGIKVDVLPADDPQAQESRELNLGFLSRMVRHRPWVRLKVAGSLDGRTALDNGQSQWITGPAARADGHAWRARASAVLTGLGTVLGDDPRLDVRDAPTMLQPLRVVLDSQWRTPPAARLLAPPGKVLIYGLAPNEGDAAARSRQQALQDAGAELVTAPESPQGQVDLPFVLQDLARQGVNELHVEAGARLNAAFIEQGLVDELLLYLAPKLIGPGRGLAALSPLAQLSDAWGLSFRDATLVGDDLRVTARPPGRDLF